GGWAGLGKGQDQGQDLEQVIFCPATEKRLLAEAKKDLYFRSMALSTMARFRSSKEDQEILLNEAVAVLSQAKAREDSLLKNASQGRDILERALSLPTPHLQNIERVEPSALPAPPVLIVRTYRSITLLPRPFLPLPLPQRGRGGGKGGGVTRAVNAT
ncbi:unnamed protein product, partial [Discosporangium mesarthrocarpum]